MTKVLIVKDISKIVLISEFFICANGKICKKLPLEGEFFFAIIEKEGSGKRKKEIR